MGFIASLLIIFIIFFYILPPLTTALLRWFVRRKARSMFSGFPGANPFDTGGKRRDSNSRPHSSGPLMKKKIGKDVGEYVDFEELTVTTEQTPNSSSTTVNYTREQQISDVEWEDLN